jgi:hypothetical protein
MLKKADSKPFAKDYKLLPSTNDAYQYFDLGWKNFNKLKIRQTNDFS